jgi:hypothetical protein
MRCHSFGIGLLHPVNAGRLALASSWGRKSFADARSELSAHSASVPSDANGITQDRRRG